MPEFEGKHVVFGEVLEGFDALDALNTLVEVNHETGEIEEGSNRI